MISFPVYSLGGKLQTRWKLAKRWSSNYGQTITINYETMKRYQHKEQVFRPTSPVVLARAMRSLLGDQAIHSTGWGSCFSPTCRKAGMLTAGEMKRRKPALMWQVKLMMWRWDLVISARGQSWRFVVVCVVVLVSLHRSYNNTVIYIAPFKRVQLQRDSQVRTIKQ